MNEKKLQKLAELIKTKRHVIGANLYRIRRSYGYTRKQIGAAIGVSPQQILKYETAASRISANNLWAIAYFLNLDINEFFKNVTVNDKIMSRDLTAFLQSEEYKKAEVTDE